MALMMEVLEEPSKNEHKYIVCVGEHLSRFLFCEGEYSEESQKAAERTFERMLQQDEWIDARPFGNVVERLEMLALDVVEEERGMVRGGVLAEEPLFEPEPYPDFLELAQEHQLVDLDYFGGLFLTLEDRTLKIAIACAFEVSLLRMGDVVLRTKTPTLSHHMEKYGFAISPNDSKWDTYSGPMLGRGQREKMLVEVPWEMKHGDELFISHFLHSKTPRTTHPTWRLRCVSTLEVDALRQECEEVLY